MPGIGKGMEQLECSYIALYEEAKLYNHFEKKSGCVLQN